MVGVVKEVECSLEEFSDDALVEEIRWRDLEYEFRDETTLDDYQDDDLATELEDRGYIVFGKKDSPISKLFTSYITDSPETFKKEIEKFFIENGFHP